MRATAPRRVEPELLDSLPEDHPDALHNRRDLLLLNRIMGNFRWFRHHVAARFRPGDFGLEIGAGDGLLGAFLHRKRVLPAGCRIDGLDLGTGRPAEWPAGWTWHREDLLTFAGYGEYSIIFGNLIFHQFEDEQLAELGARLRSAARVIAACEPCRSPVHLQQFRLLRPFGLNAVSRHDGEISIRAGFRDDELPRLLGLDPESWLIRRRATRLGAYRMLAVKKTPA